MSPWAMLIMRITPNDSDSPAAKSAYKPPSSTPCRTVLIHSAMVSVPEIGARDLLARQLGRRTLERDATFLETDDAIAHLERLPDVLLHEQKRDAFGPDLRQRAIDVTHHDRRQAERDLVSQEQPRIGHQFTAHGNHLLLASGQLGAVSFAEFAQDRKQRIHP